MRLVVRVCVAVFSGLLLSACGTDAGDTTPMVDAVVVEGDVLHRDATRNDLGAADEGVPPESVPDIEIVPLNLEFVAQAGAGPVSKDVELRNAGDTPLEIRAISVAPEGSAFSRSDVLLPLTLAPGVSQTVTVTYAAPDAEQHTGGLVIESDDPDEPRQTVTLTGRTGASCLELMPRAVDVGRVELGQPSGRFELAAQNCGDLEVRLHRVAIEGEPQFRVALGEQPGPLADLVVEAGHTTRFDVWFVNESLAEGQTALGTLRLETDLADGSVFDVGLRATGQESPMCVPVFAPTRLDFGPLRIGTTRTLPLEVTNTGSAACQILDLNISHEDGNPLNAFTFVGDTATLAVLEPGATQTVEVVFSPVERDQQGNRAAVNLVFTEAGNALNRQERAFIFGVAALAEMQAVDNALTFTTTTAPACASRPRTVGVQNIGLVPLCLTGTRLEGDDCGAFVQTAGPPAGPCVELASAGVAEWSFQFQPDRVGAHNCDFVVTGDTMNVPEVRTRLEALAVDTAATRDERDVGRLDARARAYFSLSRPADAPSIAVTLDDVPNDAWHFSNDRNSIYFEIADHPDEGAHLVIEYDARCLPRQ